LPLARSHFAGFSLRTPGLSAEGGGTDFLKWVLGLHTLGRFANGLGIGTYTTETSWSSDDFEGRTKAHVVTVEALLLEAARQAASQPSKVLQLAGDSVDLDVLRDAPGGYFPGRR
ncbi:MAG: hypothetical protein QNK03_27330, partial [Myxococcota bacterium]|nr:hypothetical protein [Myxococcota bacterium]